MLRTLHRCWYPFVLVIATLSLSAGVGGAEQAKPKIGPDEALSLLKAGNARFVAGKAENPNSDSARLHLAGTSNQGDYAYATVLTCSDSRVPVERVFDAGVMDLFVIRVAGNVCNTDEIGSIEYGLAHVRTPVLVVLGHSQCGAVTAVTQHLQGKGHELERNIPPLIKSIQPAVQRVIQEHADLSGPELIACGIEENVWTAIENLFRESPAVRSLVSADKVRVVGAIYDVGTGNVNWLSESKVYRMLGRAEVDPHRAIEAMAHPGDGPANTSSGGPTAPGKGHVVTTENSSRPDKTEPDEAHGASHVVPGAGTGHGKAPEGRSVPKKTEEGSQDPAPAAKPDAHGAEPGPEPKAHKADGSTADNGVAPAGSAHGEKKESSNATGHEAAAAADGTTSSGGPPWIAIVVCGVVFVLGLGLALGAYFMRDKASGSAAGKPAAAAPKAQAGKETAKPAA